MLDMHHVVKGIIYLSTPVLDVAFLSDTQPAGKGVVNAHRSQCSERARGAERVPWIE